MTRGKVCRLGVVFLASSTIAGCGSTFRADGQIESLDGVIASRRGIGQSQDALFSLHSLALEPGVVVRLPPETKRATPSAIVEHTDADNSYLRVETFAPDANSKADLAEIRNAIDAIVGGIASQFAGRIQLSRAEVAKREAEDAVTRAQQATEEEAKSLRVLEDKRLDIESKRLEIERRRMDLRSTMKGSDEDALLALPPLPPVSAGTQIRASGVEDGSMLAAASSRLSQATTRVTAASEGVARAGNEQTGAADRLRKALNTPNVFVFRWTAARKDEGGVDLKPFAYGSTSTKELITGYAVMNGMRRVRLVVGKDFESLAGSGSAQALGALANVPGGSIVTSVIQTKEVMYLTAEDLDSQLAAQLELKASTLVEGLSPADIQALKLQAKADLLRLRSLENTGYFTAPRVDMISIAQWADLRNNVTKPLPPDRGASGRESTFDPDWITVSAVTADIQSILAQRQTVQSTTSPSRAAAASSTQQATK